jgi:hypothetical protein
MSDQLNIDAAPCPFCGSTDISEGEVLTTWGAGGTATQSMCYGGGALVKRSEWDDAKAKRQSFNGWRLNYGDCDMSLFTENTVRSFVATYAERIRVLEREL